MGWEKRKRGGLYYTQSYRADGRVRRRYIGRGPFAEAVGRLDARDREKVQGFHRATQDEIDRIVREDREFEETARRVRQVFTEVMEMADYHRHKRWEWRRKRNVGKAGKAVKT